MVPGGSWLQQQMRAAETLLNAVDTAVMKTVTVAPDGDTASQTGELPPAQHPTEASDDEHRRTSSTGFVYATSTSPFGVAGGSPASTQGSGTSDSVQRPAVAAGVLHDSPPAPLALEREQLAQQPGQGHEDALAGNSQTTAAVPDAAPVPASRATVEPDAGWHTAAAARTVLPLPASMSVGGKRSSSGLPAPNQQPLPAAFVGADGTPGTAREQLLTRLVEQLKERLRSSKVEAEQLEDMLAQAEARCERERALLGQVQGELTAVAESKALMEAALHTQLKQQAQSLGAAQQRADVLSRQVLTLEGQLAVATSQQASMMQNRTDMEGGMLEALRSQLSAVESQLDMERRSHTATRAAAGAREEELLGAAAGNTAALADMQRTVQRGVERMRDLEDALALATARQRELEQQLGGARDGSACGPARQQGMQDMQRLQSELELERDTSERAGAACAAAQAEAKTLRAELDQLRADHTHDSWRKDAARLEASLREAHDLLYSKQSTIERLSADRAALQLRLEREVSAARTRAEGDHHALTVTEQNRPSVGLPGLTGTDQSVVPTGSVLGERYRRLAARQDNLGTALAGATALVDRTASITSYLLRQYPAVRLVSGCYLLLLHLYVYIVTLSLQHTAVVTEDASALAHPQSKAAMH